MSIQKKKRKKYASWQFDQLKFKKITHRNSKKKKSKCRYLTENQFNLLHRSFHYIRIPPTVIIWRWAISTNCSIRKVAMMVVGLLVIIVLVVIVVAANIVIMMMVHIVFDRWRRCRRRPRQMIFYWIIIYRITITNIPIPILGIPCVFKVDWKKQNHSTLVMTNFNQNIRSRAQLDDMICVWRQNKKI